MNDQQSITYTRLCKDGYQFEYEHAGLIVLSKHFEKIAIRPDGSTYTL